REEVEEFPDFHAVIDAEIVRHVADAVPHCHRVLRDAMAVDDPLSAGGFEQRPQKADRGAFAGAVGANEAEHFAGPDFEIEAFDSAKVAVVFAEIDEFDHAGREGLGLGARVGIELAYHSAPEVAAAGSVVSGSVGSVPGSLSIGGSWKWAGTGGGGGIFCTCPT